MLNADFRGAFKGGMAGLLAALIATGSAFGQVPARLLPQVTLAAGKPKLAVLVVGQDPAAYAQTARLAFFAEQAATRSDRFDTVPLVEALDAESAKARATKLEEAEEAFKGSQQANRDLDAAKGLQLAEKSLAAYEKTDLTRNFPGLIQAWLMKVASMVGSGENKAAEAELDRLIPLDPRVQLPTEFFGPEQISYAEKVKKQAMGNANTGMEVKTTPVNAQVYIDGRFAGIAPLKVNGLTPADHYVTVIAPGFTFQQTRHRTGPLEFELRKADAYSRYESAANKAKLDAEGPMRDAAAQEFGRFLGVDQVLLTMAKKSVAGEKLDVTALRIDVKDGHNFAYKQGTLALDDSIPQTADTFYTQLVQTDEQKKGGPVHHFLEKGGGGKKTLGYALLGVGGALVVGGLFFGLQASSKSGDFRQLPQTSPLAASTASTGRTYALLADVFVIAGLASAGAGGYFAFAPPGKKTEEEPEESAVDAKKQKQAEEAAKRDAENKKKAAEAEEKRKAAEEQKAEDDRRAAEAQKKADEEAAKKQEEAAASNKKKTKKELKKEEEERKKAEAEEKKRAEEERKAEAQKQKGGDDEAKKKADEEAKKKADEEAKKKKAEEDKKKADEEAAKKKKQHEEDDLRNY